MLGLFLYPEELVRGPFGFLLRGSLGHYVTLPLFSVVSFVVAIRCALTAIGSAQAIIVDSQGARIVTIWRSYRVAWIDLLRVRLDETRVRGNKVYSLKFDRRTGGTISLPLGALSVPESGYRCLAQKLSEMQLAAINAPPLKPSRSTTLVGLEVTASPVPTETARPVFGRKRAF
jgi:hypothetical protein